MRGIPTLARVLGLRRPQSGRRAFLLDLLPMDSIGVEIGVDQGRFSAKILQRVKPRELHLIDPWEHQASDTYRPSRYGGKAGDQAQMDARYHAVCARFGREIASGLVTVHRGYSATVLEQFPDDYFDWAYIDGNHLYNFVCQDLELSCRKTKVGGHIAGDDYGEGRWWKDDVTRAVDEFAQSAPVSLVEIRNRQFVFQKREPMRG